MKRWNPFTRIKCLPRTSISSATAIFLSFSLLLGATFALASVMIRTGDNTVSTGTFGVSFSLLKDTAENLNDAEGWSAIDEETAVFDCSNWQQSSTAVKVIRVQNTGTVPLKWKVAIVPGTATATASTVDLAEVIDVYCAAVTAIPQMTVDAQSEVVTCDLSGWTKVGTLRELLDGDKDWPVQILKGGAVANAGIALQMQGDADEAYLGQTATFVIKLLAVQAVEDGDQWAADGNTPPVSPSTGAASGGSSSSPEETTAAPAPEETTAAPAPEQTVPDGVYRASNETAAVNTDLKQTKLGEAFVVMYQTEDGAGKLLDSSYSLTKGELRTDTAQAYALTVKPDPNAESYDFKLFVRSQGVADMFDENSTSAGDGVQIRLKKDGSEYKIYFYIKRYDEQTNTISVVNRYLALTSIDTLTVADNGETVYVLVDNTIYAVIDIDSSESVPHYTLTESTDILFAGTAGLAYKDQQELEDIVCTNTLIAPDCDAQCGLVALNNATFSEISLRPYSDVADTITANLPSFNPAS